MFALHALVLALASAACLCAAYEGEALTYLLANEVNVTSKTNLLPECFVVHNTPADRDVGPYIYHTPWQCPVEVVRSSLETQAELQNSNPQIEIVRILQADSQDATSLSSDYRMGLSSGGQEVKRLNGLVNPTAAATVKGWTDQKYQALKAWMDAQSSDTLMLLHDSGKSLFAGCNESVILSKFNTIINASGGTQKIVLAGEISPFHDDFGFWYSSPYGPNPNIDDTRSQFLSRMRGSPFLCTGCTEAWATTHAACSTGYCGTPPKYQFPSAGLIMGKVGDVAEMLSGFDKFDGSLDRHVSNYFLKHPDDVAIDYAGVLVFSLHNMDLVSSVGLPVRLDEENGEKFFTNTATTNDRVCFLHGDGNSFDYLKTLATDLLR